MRRGVGHSLLFPLLMFVVGSRRAARLRSPRPVTRDRCDEGRRPPSVPNRRCPGSPRYLSLGPPSLRLSALLAGGRDHAGPGPAEPAVLAPDVGLGPVSPRLVAEVAGVDDQALLAALHVEDEARDGDVGYAGEGAP